MEMTLGEAFARSARKFPHKTACMDDQGRLTYQFLNQRVNRWAHACQGLELVKGDHVASLGSNSLDLMTILLGNLKLGLVTVPLDSRGTVEEICHQAASTDCKALFFDVAYAGAAEEMRSRLPGLGLMVGFGGPAPGFALDWEELLNKSAEQEPAALLKEEDEAFILFTGGTTGLPKGAILTHRNFMWNTISVTTENHSPAPEDVIYYPMQIYHAAALSRFLAYMYAGATFIGSKGLDPDRYLDVVERERTTFVVGNPTIYKMLLAANRRRRRDTSSMLRWLNSQGRLSPTEKAEIQTELWPNAAYYSSYALTEASPAVTVLRPWDRPDEWGSVGRAYMCTEVRIVDPQDGEQPVGTPGEIIVRGPTVFKGYYNNPQETARALRNGWLHTGDVGKTDSQGFIYLVDRLKDMIKTGGLNVYSQEVEAVIGTHPGVAEVAVIGVPHAQWGEAVCAVVVPRAGAQIGPQEIIEHCRGRMASYKKPALVRLAAELPKGTFGGKILKRKLREMVAGELAGQEAGGAPTGPKPTGK
ncbi:MAG: long-chain fatty acid--CoA ligase [Desulfarculus sp.]|jgi:acyl-CoA synthetase (AMP-forming)/AMP-acid ligase II|nr:MAG: long-chain fatty acid--CoA ligase [Desulfarculus sp.]